jgi:exodeoxyribonuclease VII small subunit
MENRTFEEKLELIKKILNKLIEPNITLQESIRLYEKGLKNIKEAQKIIEEAKTKIKMVKIEDAKA